jgi:hypothetical protein
MGKTHYGVVMEQPLLGISHPVPPASTKYRSGGPRIQAEVRASPLTFKTLMEKPESMSTSGQMEDSGTALATFISTKGQVMPLR